jgi:hypothetical protein
MQGSRRELQSSATHFPLGTRQFEAGFLAQRNNLLLEPGS